MSFISIALRRNGSGYSGMGFAGCGRHELTVHSIGVACIAAQWHATKWGGMEGAAMDGCLAPISNAAQCRAMPSNTIVQFHAAQSYVASYPTPPRTWHWWHVFLTMDGSLVSISMAANAIPLHAAMSNGIHDMTLAAHIAPWKWMGMGRPMHCRPMACH